MNKETNATGGAKPEKPTLEQYVQLFTKINPKKLYDKGTPWAKTGQQRLEAIVEIAKIVKQMVLSY